MAIKVGINGFGRIGRLAYRAMVKDPEIQVVAVNDLGDIPTMAHLLKYDSVHGRAFDTVEVTEDGFVADGHAVKVLCERDPENLPWGELGVDVVLECTGKFRSAPELRKHIECGAKNGIFPVDDICRQYLAERFDGEVVAYEADADAEYSREITIDLAALRPQVAFPHLPSNTHAVDEIDKIAIDQVVIGSCTNGRLEDMRVAGEILKGKKVAPYLRLIVIPGTQDVYEACMKEGITQTILDAGGVVSTPTCGPCLGGYMGILAKGERALSTTNRNFVGRMGDPESEVYLCNPAVAAASAVTGYITNPEEV